MIGDANLQGTEPLQLTDVARYFRGICRESLQQRRADRDGRRPDRRGEGIGIALVAPADLDGPHQATSPAALDHESQDWVIDEREINVVDLDRRQVGAILQKEGSLLDGDNWHRLVEVGRRKDAGEAPMALGD